MRFSDSVLVFQLCNRGQLDLHLKKYLRTTGFGQLERHSVGVPFQLSEMVQLNHAVPSRQLSALNN
jgi:hypothetical protein